MYLFYLFIHFKLSRVIYLSFYSFCLIPSGNISQGDSHYRRHKLLQSYLFTCTWSVPLLKEKIRKRNYKKNLFISCLWRWNFCKDEFLSFKFSYTTCREYKEIIFKSCYPAVNSFTIKGNCHQGNLRKSVSKKYCCGCMRWGVSDTNNDGSWVISVGFSLRYFVQCTWWLCESLQM